MILQQKKITQDSERAKGSTVIIFPWERGFFYTRYVDVATESVNHSVKQTITDCIIVILLTIWETEQPFWLKRWLWFMNSQKTVQLNKSRMWSIMKIFPKSPPPPLCWKARKSFIVVEGWKERLSFAAEMSLLCNFIIWLSSRKTENRMWQKWQETCLHKKFHIPKIKVSFSRTYSWVPDNNLICINSRTISLDFHSVYSIELDQLFKDANILS